MKKRYHIGIHILDALQKGDLAGLLTEDGIAMPETDVRRILIAEANKGHEVYCPCSNRAPNGRCAGHQIQ